MAYNKWLHPSNTIAIKDKREDQTYSVRRFTDGSKTETGAGSGIAIYINTEPVQKLHYRLDNRRSNNQAEQFAILKATEELNKLNNVAAKTAAIHTDSRITLDLLRNNSNQNTLIEDIKRNIRAPEGKHWSIHLACRE